MIEPNIVLCCLAWFIFGLQHSLLARPVTKRWIARVFGTVFEAHIYPVTYFVIQCIVFLACYDAIRHLSPGVVFYQLPSEWTEPVFWLNRIANIFLILTVFHFDIGSFTGFKQLFRLLLRKGINSDAPQPEPVLNTSYLYRFIRHPMYLGIILVYATSTTVYSDLFFVSLMCIIAYIELGSYFEEKTLHKRFGGDYAIYVSQTKRYIPFLR